MGFILPIQRAFKEFQNCLEKYPDTERFNETLKYQYDIACLFLAGERQKVWKIPTLPSMDKAVEILPRLGRVIRVSFDIASAGGGLDESSFDDIAGEILDYVVVKAQQASGVRAGGVAERGTT